MTPRLPSTLGQFNPAHAMAAATRRDRKHTSESAIAVLALLTAALMGALIGPSQAEGTALTLQRFIFRLSSLSICDAPRLAGLMAAAATLWVMSFSLTALDRIPGAV